MKTPHRTAASILIALAITACGEADIPTAPETPSDTTYEDVPQLAERLITTEPNPRTLTDAVCHIEAIDGSWQSEEVDAGSTLELEEGFYVPTCNADNYQETVGTEFYATPNTHDVVAVSLIPEGTVLTTAKVAVNTNPTARVDSVIRVSADGSRELLDLQTKQAPAVYTLDAGSSAYVFWASTDGYTSASGIAFPEPGEFAVVQIDLAQLPPDPPNEPTTGHVAVWSAPEGATYTLRHIESNTVLSSGSTNALLEMEPACVIVEIEKEGYSSLTDAVCVSAGEQVEIGGVLPTEETPAEQPIARLDVSPSTVEMGEKVSVCLETRYVGTTLISPIGAVTEYSDPSETRRSCFTDHPTTNTDYIALAAGAGGVVTTQTSVIVSAPPEMVIDSVSCDIEKDVAILTRDDKLGRTICSVNIPEEAQEAWATIHAGYSGKGQKNEAFAVSLVKNGSQTFAYSGEHTCPVVEDLHRFSGFTWREAGQFEVVPTGTVDVHVDHAIRFDPDANGKLGNCYKPNNKYTADSIHFRNDHTNRGVIIYFTRPQ